MTGRNLTTGEGSADPNSLRQLSHKIADLVYEEFTGDSGYFDTQIVYVSESGAGQSGSNGWRSWIRTATITNI